MKPNTGYYARQINDIVQETETIGENMHEHYEVIRQAIDQKTTAELTAERLQEIQTVFKEGTARYEALFSQIGQLKAPIKVMGLHKKFERAYQTYVEGCQAMVASVNPETGVAAQAFDDAEMVQDKATDEISFAITKMSRLLLK